MYTHLRPASCSCTTCTMATGSGEPLNLNTPSRSTSTVVGGAGSTAAAGAGAGAALCSRATWSGRIAIEKLPGRLGAYGAALGGIRPVKLRGRAAAE